MLERVYNYMAYSLFGSLLMYYFYFQLIILWSLFTVMFAVKYFFATPIGGIILASFLVVEWVLCTALVSFYRLRKEMRLRATFLERYINPADEEIKKEYNRAVKAEYERLSSMLENEPGVTVKKY